MASLLLTREEIETFLYTFIIMMLQTYTITFRFSSSDNYIDGCAHMGQDIGTTIVRLTGGEGLGSVVQWLCYHKILKSFVTLYPDETFVYSLKQPLRSIECYSQVPRCMYGSTSRCSTQPHT